MPRRQDLSVIVIGAGLGGIGAAIELRDHAFDVTVLERGPDMGGTWYYNGYPGAACDVPSHLYSYSFAKRRDWSRLCSPQQEILDYVHGVAREHGVDQLVVTNADVSACAFDDDTARWTVRSADGRSWEADALVVATGQLHQPAVPRIEGREQFEGHSFHSAQWDHDYDLQGKRVAVVGTGASAVQFVPEIAQEAGRLFVFQRTGNWFLPRKNRPYPPPVRWAIEHVPGLQAYRRRFMYYYCESLTMMIRHPASLGRVGKLRSALFMRAQLHDPEVRRNAWPDYTFGCKRILFSSAFLPALQRPNVTLVTDPIACFERDAIVTADGSRYEIDCVIYGTGFKTNDFMFPMEITGAGGRSLVEAWAGGPTAHLGMTVPGFPSMFLMYGPNTNTSGGSIIFYGETQARYIRQALSWVRSTGVAAIEVRPEVAVHSDAQVQANFAGTAWTRCDSWYRDPNGRIVANWPGYMREYEQATRSLDPAEYEFIAARARDDDALEESVAAAS